VAFAAVLFVPALPDDLGLMRPANPVVLPAELP
jgi:hypothetical protein